LPARHDRHDEGVIAASPSPELSCVVHVHSTYSDGTASVPELLEAAREAGVDAVLLTDHDTLAARRDGWEGHHDGVFLMVGLEVSPKQGHYLAFGVDEVIPHRGLSAAEIASAVRAAGGTGFAAHPFSRGGHMLIPSLARRIVLPHGWPALEEDGGLDGLELWSVLTDAAEAWRTPAEVVRWLREPEAAVAGGPPAHHLAVWDALSARRRVPAIGGLDDHQRGIRLRGRVRSPVPPSRTFNLLRTHLLCERGLDGDVGRDRQTILAALRSGSAWLTCPSVAPARGARMWAERADGSTMGIGAEGPAGSSVLRLRLPQAADVTVRRDGAAIHTAQSAELDLEIADPGGYRVEARIDGRLWLLSNPIHLR
jgi:PHP domain